MNSSVCSSADMWFFTSMPCEYATSMTTFESRSYSFAS